MENLLYYWKPIVEILILWFVIYEVMLFFEGTRALQVIRGIVVLLIAYFIFLKLGFEILDWLLGQLFTISVIAMMIIFSPEIRQGLARLGKRRFGFSLKQEELDYLLKQLSEAAQNLSRAKHGAIIAIEKNDPLTAYIESGVIIDGQVSSELIETIFDRATILHDGGLIIQRGRISAAGCIFPLTENHELSRIFGTRHRAALGLSEETDAIIVVISEERQDIALVYQGKMYKDLSTKELSEKIEQLIKVK